MPLRAAMPLRKAVLTAGAATALAALVLGGSSTYASWTDSAETTTTITAGQLTAEIAQTGPTSVRSGTRSGIYPAAGDGIIPGVQNLEWWYTLTNTSASSVLADATLRLRGTPVDTTTYEAVRPYLRGTAHTISPTHRPFSFSVPPSAFTASGLDFDVDLSSRLPPLNPGEWIAVVLVLRMQETENTPQGRVNVAMEVQSQRSASTAAQPILAMTNQVFLEQASTR